MAATRKRFKLRNVELTKAERAQLDLDFYTRSNWLGEWKSSAEYPVDLAHPLRCGIVNLENGKQPIHYLKHSTLVRILHESERFFIVEPLVPGCAVEVAQWKSDICSQVVPLQDVWEIAPDQIAALRECMPLLPLKSASACMQAWPVPVNKYDALSRVRAIVRKDLARKLAERLIEIDPEELWRRLHSVPDSPD